MCKNNVNIGWVLAVLIAAAGCGGATDNPATATTAQVSLSVQSPKSTSASVSDAPASSVSKGLKAEGSNSVELAVSEEPTDSSIGKDVTVTCTRYDTGEVLGTGKTDANGAVVINVNPEKANGKDLLFTADKGNGVTFQKLVTEASATLGSTTDAGTVNSDSTVVVEQVARNCEKVLGVTVSTSDLSQCATAQAAGTIAPPKSLVKIYEAMFSGSGSAGTDSELGVLLANRLAFKKAIVNGQANPRDFLNKLFEGDSSALSQASADTGLTMDATVISKYVDDALVGKNAIFNDTDTFKKCNETGQWSKYADLWATADPTQIKGNPDLYKNQFQVASDNYKGGDTTAFNLLSTAPKLFAEIGEQCKGVFTISSSDQGAAANKYFSQLIEQGKSSDASTRSTLAQAGCKMMASAAEDSSKLTLLKNDPTTFAGSTVNNPGALTGSSGSTVITNMFTAGSQLGQAVKPCASSSDCASGEACTPQYFCASSTVSCTSNCALGNACTGNSNCATGLCSNNFCAMSATADPLSAKPQGTACTSNAGCASGQCSSGVCAVPSQGDSGGSSLSVASLATTLGTVIASSGTTGIATDSTLRLTFSEAALSSTVNTTTVTLNCSGAKAVTIAAVTAGSTSTAFTITPTAELPASTSCTVAASTGVTNASSVAITAYSRSFTTAAAVPPSISSVTGKASGTSTNATIATTGTTGISVKTSNPLTIAFDRAMTANTVSTSNVALFLNGSPVAIALAATSGANTSFTATPSANLSQMTDYELTIGTGVQSSIGTAMSSAASYAFKTGCTTNDNFGNAATLSTSATKCWTTGNSSNASTFAIQNGVLDMQVAANTSTGFSRPKATKTFPDSTTSIVVTTKVTFSNMSDNGDRCSLVLQDSGGFSAKGVTLAVLPAGGGAVQAADFVQGSNPSTSVSVSSPVYIRLSLSGGTITSAYSSNGTDFTNLDTTFSFSSTSGSILVDLNVGNGTGDASGTVCKFDDFTVTNASATSQD